MIHRGLTDKNTSYHVLSVTPAATYNGACAPTVYVSTDAQAISNLRDQLIRNEDVNHTGGPQVYAVHRMTIPDDLRRAMVDQQIQRSTFGAPARVAPTGMLSQDHDVIVGRDYFHDQSQWMTKGYNGVRDTVIGVRTEMQGREQVLQAFADAAAKTNPYKMLDADELARPDTKAAMEMAFMGKELNHFALYPAVSMMAKNGLDTAEMVPEFQKEYEKQLETLGEKHPEWGKHTLQNEALTATAWTFQTTMCGNDMRQQGVFQFIAGQSRTMQEQCAQLDSQERDQAFTYATQELSSHLQQNGQYIDNRTAQGFRNQVMMTVGERVNREGFSQEMVQRAIKDVAREFEKGVREHGDDKAGFNFANIADRAEAMEADLHEHGENDGREDVSIDD